MWDRASESQRWALVVAVGAMVLLAIDIWWFVTYRDGFPLNVDEAGYTSIAVIDYIGLKANGIDGWWDAVQTQTPNAPLLPALTSLLLLIKPGVLTGFAALASFIVLLAFATYGIGERLAGPRLGALAALVTAAMPGTLIFAHEYVFALPTATFMACAVCALVRSDGLRLRRWTLLCGAALGFMLLSRTMAIAFVPGVLAAAGVLVLARGRGDFPNRLLNLALLIVAGAAVAATWYWRNLQPVIDYLTDFGYGNQAQYYGEEASLFSWERLHTVAERMIFDDLLVPIAALVFVALLTIGVAAAQRLRRSQDRRGELIRLAGTDALAVFIVVVAGYAALTTSQNGGNGFTIPISALLPPLAVLALRLHRVATAPVVVLLAAITAMNLAASSNLWEGVSKPRSVAVPGFGYLPWINGTPHTIDAIRVQVPGSEIHFDESDRRWIQIDEQLADLLVKPLGPDGLPPVVAFASRNRLISTNSVQLAAVLKHHRTIPFTQLVAEPSDSVRNYTRQLGPDFGMPSVVVTMSRNTDDFPPLVTQAHVEAAVKKAGFRRIRTIALPDRRRLFVWLKGSSPTQPMGTTRPSRSSGETSSESLDPHG